MEILLTGGVGDIIALDAVWTASEKEEITKIHWATRIGRLLMPIFAKLPQYSSLKSQVDHWDYDQTALQCYMHADHAREHGVKLSKKVVDRSVWFEFQRIVREDLKFQGSSFLETTLCGIIRPLPERYAVIHPTTPVNTAAHRQVRDFTVNDWGRTLLWLERRNITGVVINQEDGGYVPNHPRILDLTGQTSLAESMEIVKGAEDFVGIDSWAAILASMRLLPENLAILSRNTYLYGHLRQYYPTHRTHEFVAREIREPNPR